MNKYVYKPKEKSRVQQINESILHHIDTVYRLRKIRYSLIDNKPCYAYVVSLAKNHTYSLKEQTLSFYEHLKLILSSNETLTTENKCFQITATDFEVSYLLRHGESTQIQQHISKTAK